MSAHRFPCVLDSDEAERAVEDFCEFLRFETVSGSAPTTGAYDAAAAWIQQRLSAVGVASVVLPESLPHKPIVVAACRLARDGGGAASGAGRDVLANSHYDVVPTEPSHWSVPAFAGVRQNGRVYGRGAQDMKCVCVQYLAALAKLHALGQLRGVDFAPGQPLPVDDGQILWLSFVPDEEIGGGDGMRRLIGSSWFEAVRGRIGLALDEGLASPDDRYCVFYGERLPCWVRVRATGNTGHGSRFVDGTAVEQLIEVANRALRFRQQQRALLHGDDRQHSHSCEHAVAAASKLTLGDVTSLNVTYLRAGMVSPSGTIAANVIPSDAELVLDIRIAPHVEPASVHAMLDEWVQQVTAACGGLQPGDGVTWEFIDRSDRALQRHATTKLDDDNPWWRAFAAVFAEQVGVALEQMVFPAATDSRYLRGLGIDAIGFSPMRLSPVLLHDHDEYLDESIFVEGCSVYVLLFQRLLALQ